MRCRWGNLLLAGLMLADPVEAQKAREIGVHALVAFSNPALGVAGGYAGLRTSTRTRLATDLGLGVSGGELSWRGEILGSFLLSPEERRRPGLYLSGGLAAVGGEVSRGYLILTLGVEDRPRAPSGWALEAGVGGGVRLSLGYRWRRFPGLTPE